jgi:aromatic ring-cleaving dioxygenase
MRRTRKVKRLKYLIWSGAPIDVNSKIKLPSGLFMWVNAFRQHGLSGDANCTLTKEFLEGFDLIHTNWTPAAASYISGIRNVLGDHSSTKIIANVDHAIGMWGGINPFTMVQELKMADFVFHVEPYGAAGIGQLMGKEIPVIPHPVDVEWIKTQRKPTDEPIVITCHYHRYLETWSEYFRATWRLRQKYPELRTVLLGVSEPPKLTVGINPMFTNALTRMPFENFIDFLSRAYLNMSVTVDSTYGRDIVEAAALGVPTVGSRSIAAMRYIWPKQAFASVDTLSMEKELDKMILDADYTAKLSEQGTERSEFYSIKRSHNRMVRELEKAEVI